MTNLERNELSEMNLRLFGLDGQSGMYGDLQEIKRELAEWRGAIRLVRYGGSLLGLGGIVTIVAALMGTR